MHYVLAMNVRERERERERRHWWDDPLRSLTSSVPIRDGSVLLYMHADMFANATATSSSSPYFLFKGHKDNAREGMRISKFTHSEKQGGTTSRGIVSSEQLLWEDSDGFPWTSDISFGVRYVVVGIAHVHEYVSQHCSDGIEIM